MKFGVNMQNLVNNNYMTKYSPLSITQVCISVFTRKIKDLCEKLHTEGGDKNILAEKYARLAIFFK